MELEGRRVADVWVMFSTNVLLGGLTAWGSEWGQSLEGIS